MLTQAISGGSCRVTAKGCLDNGSSNPSDPNAGLHVREPRSVRRHIFRCQWRGTQTHCLGTNSRSDTLHTLVVESTDVLT